LDKNGLIMKALESPIPAGQYYVTNGEENISLLTVEEANAEGKMSHTAHAGLRDIRPKVKAVPARQNMRTGLLSR
jgi:hypothetical protein